MSTDSERISLADAIAGLRQEILRASQSARTLDQTERYRITEVQIELTVVADESMEGTGEVGWWVLKAKAGVSATDSLSQKIVLKLDIGDVEVGSGRKSL